MGTAFISMWRVERRIATKYLQVLATHLIVAAAGTGLELVFSLV